MFKSIAKYKSLITNIFSLILIIIGFLCDNNNYKNVILNIGFFAFSGAITNWIAIYMLFEKIPFLYGSGVIPRRFEDFKNGIKSLILEEFFTVKNINKFLSKNSFSLNTDKINKKIDFEKIFNDLIDAILESPLGGMVAMVGGKEALMPLKDPIISKLKETIDNIVSDVGNVESENSISATLQSEIEKIINSRLAELTPKIVKEIIQKMIKKHLGWLVVWGGVFGGIIGLIFGIIGKM